MVTLNLSKTPVGVPQELHSAFSDVYNALWALQSSQASGTSSSVSMVPGVGISIRVDGNSYIISSTGITKVIPIGDGYELLAPANDAGTYNLFSILAGDNIDMSLDKERGLTISAKLSKVDWSAIIDPPATYPPSVHAHALSDVVLYRRGNTNFKTVSDYFELVQSSCLLSGGEVTLNPDCSVAVAVGSCLVRETPDGIGRLYSYDFPAALLPVVAVGTTKRVVITQSTIINADGSVTRSTAPQLADSANESNSLTLAVVSNVNGVLHFILKPPGAADLLKLIVNREAAIAPVAVEASKGFRLSTGVSRTIQVEAGAVWAGMTRYPHLLRDSATKPITEVYGAQFGLTLSSWPNSKYYSSGASALVSLAAGSYGCLWFYSSIDTDDWFVVYGDAQYVTASVAASAEFPGYLTQQFKNTTFFLGRLIFLANADSPFDLETSAGFGVSGTVAKFADLVNSYASLVNGKVPESQLPSYVDDVLEFEDNTKFPTIGERGKIYVDCLNNATYRWTGTTYVKIGDGSSSALASTDALPEGTVNKYYLDSRARAALSATGSLAYNPTTGVLSYTAPASEPPLAAGTSSQYYRGDKTWQTLDKTAVGLSNVDNTADLAKPVSTAQATAIAAKEPTVVAGNSSQYWAGTKAWTDFATSVRSAVLTGLSVATNAAVVATDSVLAAIGKIQAHLAANDSAIAGKEPAIVAGSSAQFWRGDKTWQGIDKTTVGLGNVDNKSSATIRSEITKADISNSLGGAAPIVFTVAAAGNSTLWVNLGTYLSNQVGYTIKIDIIGHNGFNATITQNFISTVFFKTSNGMSADVNGFYGDGYYYTFGPGSSLLGAKVVANTAQPSNSFDIYVQFASFADNSIVAVTCPADTSFAIKNTIAADPGAASAAVCVLQPYDVKLNNKSIITDGKYNTLAGYGITDALAVNSDKSLQQLSDNFDLNNIAITGFFRVYAPNNGPNNSNSGWQYIECFAHDSSFVYQIAHAYGGNDYTYTRRKNAGAWSAWTRVAKAADISWDDLNTNQPSFLLDGNNKYVMRITRDSDGYASYMDWRKWTGSNNDYYWTQIRNAGTMLDFNCGVGCAATDYGAVPASFDTKFRFNLWEGRLSIYEGYANGGGQLQLVDKTGNSKTLRCLNNQFSMTNSANTANVLEVDDAGNVKNYGWHTSAQGLFAGDSQSEGLLPGRQDGASWTGNNLKIQSWFGIGFACSSSGMPTSGQYSHVFNTRNGDFSAYGFIAAAGNIYCGDASVGTNAERQIHFRNGYGDVYWYLQTGGVFGLWDSTNAGSRINLYSDKTAKFYNTVTIETGAGQNAGIDVYSTEAAGWKSRIISRNSTNDRAVFLGQYRGRPGVFMHNYDMNSFGPQHALWLNTIGQYGHASVYLPEETYTVTSGTDNLNPILSTKNFSTYTCDLTNGVSPDITGSDLNALTRAGFYRGYNLGNAPTAGWYFILVQGHDNKGTADGWCSQTIIGYGSNGSTPNTIQQRIKTGSSWTGWNTFITTDNIAAQVAANLPAQEAWHSVTLPSAWSGSLQYMKDSFGFVHLQGVVVTPVNSTDTVTLPAGYRPSVSHPLIGLNGSGSVVAGGSILASGVISCGVSSIQTWFGSVSFRAA